MQLFGHEFCARIVEVGKGVTRYRAGRSRGRPGQAALHELRAVQLGPQRALPHADR